MQSQAQLFLLGTQRQQLLLWGGQHVLGCTHLGQGGIGQRASDSDSALGRNRRHR